MPVEDQTLLNVREAARQLGVHENTVRAWVRAGMLSTAKVPGSRFHRFHAADVERLQRQRGRPFATSARELSMIGPELIDATQLANWARTRDAQSGFPELVRRLLVATRGVTNISMRSGDGVQLGGWDGRADCSGTDFLPSGALWFELGVGTHIASKAKVDHKKRSEQPEGAVPVESIFVFMTPRRSREIKAWAARERDESPFSNVIALDADDLEGWLHATPAVHHWISERLGRHPADAETLMRWWMRFRAKTDPALSEPFFLAGRDAQQRRIGERFRDSTQSPAVVTVQADWRDDAVAFTHAALTKASDESEIPPPLVIYSSKAWDAVVHEPGRVTLIPMFSDPDLASAEARGHAVVLPLGRDQIAVGERIALPRPELMSAARALETAGVGFDRSHRLAGLARRSMPAFMRKLARDPRISRPAWAQPEHAEILAPLVLLGSWSSREADEEIVSELVDQPYTTIERSLRHWAASDDAPFVRSGDQWRVAARDEAFLLLHHALTQSDLERWGRAVTRVLLETDPTLDLQPDERLTAGIRGITRRYSSVLRDGIAVGLALAGSSDRGFLQEESPAVAGKARDLVRGILGQAGRDASGQTWRSLGDELPRLAEASPEGFLDAVNDDLAKPSPLLKGMFQDGPDRGTALFSSSPHTGLLWALETLCWSPDYVLSAARALARLQVIDEPRGRLANRPLRSLQSVLVPWIHQTAASLEVKINAIEAICRETPDIGWELILALWPARQGIANPPAAPRFYDWTPASRNVPIAEWFEYVRVLVDLAIDSAGTSAERWATVARRLSALPERERSRLIDELDRFTRTQPITEEQRVALWEQLSDEIARHRQFPDADWSLGEETLTRLQAVNDQLKPEHGPGRFAFLFGSHPRLSGVDNHDFAAYQAELLRRREHAVSETLNEGSIDGVKALAASSDAPVHLGRALATVAGDEFAAELLSWLDCSDQKRRTVAIGWAERVLCENGIDWLRSALATPAMSPVERQTVLTICAQPSHELWDLLVETSQELSDAYWTRTTAWGASPGDTERAVGELLAHKRPWVAVDLLATFLHAPDGRPIELPPELIESILTACLSADPAEAEQQNLGYEVGLLLDHLESRDVEAARLAQYEFMFFRLLEDIRDPRALYSALSSQPELFVDLVSRVYRGRNEPRKALSEDESALANHAWWVLETWDRVPGADGQSLDGEYLKSWVHRARLAFDTSDRADIGDERIGQVLAASPSGTDEIWPAEPVREILETIGSPSIESGLRTGVINQRGTTSRGVFEGGKQEWDLAAKYRDWSGQTLSQWPRTSRLLRVLAEDYEEDARSQDSEATVRQDTE